MSGTLAGKTALVLGVETAPGTAAARALAEAGASVACVAGATDGAAAFEAQKLARSLAAGGVRALAQAIDAGIGTAVQITFRQLARELGPIDVFVCATSAVLDKPLTRLTDAEWAKLLAVNLTSVFAGIRAASREMAENGVILVVVPRQTANAAGAAMKAARAALVAGIAGELAERSVRILTVTDGDAPAELSATVVRLSGGPDADADAGR